jgi:mRNA-degrading endonuclease toxin of MazEF toxin-antitoxin module
MQRGEIYWLPFGEPCPKLDEATGAPVVDGDGKIVLEVKRRPIIIMSRDTLNGGHYVVAVPCYSQDIDHRMQYPQNVLLERGEGGLPKRCIARTDQITFVDKKFIDWRKDKIGRLPVSKMAEIVRAIRWVVRDDDLQS